jgi:murein DD-endopeptidase MepM/ murein hydrolase activator NlpD
VIEAEVKVGSTVENAFMTYVGENPHLFPPIYGRLMMLLPSSLAPGINRDILNIDFSAGTATQTQFTTRLQLLYNIVERLRMSMYDTPRGDIVVEAPLYWVDRDDIDDPSLKERFSFELKDTIEHSAHFTDERVKTRIISSYNTIQGLASGVVADSAGLAPSAVTLDSLVPAFGVRVEYASPYGAIASPLAARYHAFLHLTRINAEAWRETVQTIYRPGLSPNRSCWFECADFHACIRAVNFSIRWGKSGSVSQTLTLDTRRGWSGMIAQVKQGKQTKLRKVYESYGGRASDPIDYSLLFREIPTQSTMPLSGESDKSSVAPTTSTDGPLVSSNTLPGKSLSSIVPKGKVTSRFGLRIHPIDDVEKMHTGIDIGAPRGSSIKAPAGGTVVKFGNSASYGIHAEVRHADGTSSFYAHMDPTTTILAIGQTVAQGDELGKVGSTGKSSNPHLHFEMRGSDGKAIDPLRVGGMTP